MTKLHTQTHNLTIKQNEEFKDKIKDGEESDKIKEAGNQLRNLCTGCDTPLGLVYKKV